MPSGVFNTSQKNKKQPLTPSGLSVIVNNTETASGSPWKDVQTESLKRSDKMATEQTGLTVEMEDGSTEVFGAKKKMVKVTTIANGKVSTKLSFLNGRVVVFDMPEDMVLRFAAHGSDQKFGDIIAGLGDIEDAILAVEELAGRLAAGEWSQKREGSGLGGTSVLVRALMLMMGKDAETIKKFLAEKNQAEKIALRNNPRVKPFVDRVEAEKAVKAGRVSIDTDALLDELN